MPSKYRKTITIGHDPISNMPIRKTFSGKTKKSVNKKIDDFKLALATGKGYTTHSIPFSKWADTWIRTYKEGSDIQDTTLRGYEICINHLNETFAKQPINAITPVMCQEFFKRKSTLSQSMVNKLRNTLVAIFDAAVDNDLLYRNPAKNIKSVKGKAPEEKRVFTQTEANIVKEYAKVHPDGLGVFIILSTGIRRGELMGIRPTEDFDAENNRLIIRRTIQESRGVIKIKDELKNHDKYRIIPLSPKDAEYLKNHPTFKKPGYLFQARHKTKEWPMAPANWSRYLLTRFYEDLDIYLDQNNINPIEHLNPHELRHTYGTLLFKAGSDPYAVQKIMGHKSLNVTMSIYVHDDINDVESRVVFPDEVSA